MFKKLSRPTPVVLSLALGSLVPLTGCVDGILSCQPNASDPFQGQWQESASISCEDGSESPPKTQLMRRLITSYRP